MKKSSFILGFICILCIGFVGNVQAQSVTLTPIIDGTIRTSGYTTPARIYHIRTGLDIQITANELLSNPVAYLSLTGMADDPANNSLTYRVRVYHPLPKYALWVSLLNASLAGFDDRSVSTFTGDINPILAGPFGSKILQSTVVTISVTARSKLPGFATLTYALYSADMTPLADTGFMNLEFTRPSLALSGTNPVFYEYNSGINPNLDVVITETGLYPDRTPIGINTGNFSVSIDDGTGAVLSLTGLTLTGLYATIPTLGLGAYNITYYYTGADADTVDIANTISGTYVHAVPLHNVLTVQDTTPPTIDILSPLDSTTISSANSVTMTFTGTDNYTLSPVVFECKIDGSDWTSCSSSITYTALANGTYTMRVRAIDFSGNSTEKSVSITINMSTSGPGGWGGGQGPDQCPNGDYTDSYYDNQCGTKPHTDIYNDTIQDGYCAKRKNNVSIVDSLSINTTDEFKRGLTFLYAYDMTMFRSIDEFDPNRQLTREEAAKIFSNFAMNVLCRKPDENLNINYDDINITNPTLTKYIILAYQLGLMKGGTDGQFRPFDMITEAEFNAVLIRMILKSYLPEDGTDVRYKEYNDVSLQLGIISYPAGENAIMRSESAIMLFRAYRDQNFDLRDIDYETYVLDTRDEYIP